MHSLFFNNRHSEDLCIAFPRYFLYTYTERRKHIFTVASAKIYVINDSEAFHFSRHFSLQYNGCISAHAKSSTLHVRSLRNRSKEGFLRLLCR